MRNELICITKIKRMKQDEHKLQVAAHLLLSAHNIFHFAIPNGGNRDARTGAILKSEGVLAGVADMCILLGQGICIFIEFKTRIGKQSVSQIEFNENVNRLGFHYYIIRDIDELILLIQRLKKRYNSK